MLSSFSELELVNTGTGRVRVRVRVFELVSLPELPEPDAGGFLTTEIRGLVSFLESELETITILGLCLIAFLSRRFRG